MGADTLVTRHTGRAGQIPPYLRPILRAYIFGYATSTGPRLFGFLRVIVRKDLNLREKIKILYRILKTSLEPTRFPAAGAVIVGGATALPRLIHNVLQWLLSALSGGSIKDLGPKSLSRIRFVTTFFSAWSAFGLLNKDQEWTRRRARSIAASRADVAERLSEHQFALPGPTVKWSGKTIDFTLFALSRALDTLVNELWSKSKTRPSHPVHHYPEISNLVQDMADPLVFTSSAAIIMYAWFYCPDRLPKNYRKWISAAASIDSRLIQALRLCRQGIFLYGQDTGQAPLLGGLSTDLGLPETMGDPKITIPVPCELVHCGSGPSCEYHALSRWLKAFVFSMNVYVPLQLLTRIGPLFNKKSTAPARLKLLKSLARSSARSSSFLATFITTFYYTVCLVRTRLPQLYTILFRQPVFSKRNIRPISIRTRQRIDSGLCVISACMTCGLSILAETKSKRQEISAFVVPRAMATLLPRVYDARHAWKEQVVFASSVAVVLTSLMADGGKQHVRGVLGRALGQVLKEG